MNTFWLNFIVTEAIGVAQAFLSMSGLSSELKTALSNLIESGHAVTGAIHLKK